MIYCDEAGERFGTGQEMIEEIKRLRAKVVRTADGAPVAALDFVYIVFPGDRGVTCLTVESLKARTQSFEQVPVFDCHSTPAAALADAKRRASPQSAAEGGGMRLDDIRSGLQAKVSAAQKAEELAVAAIQSSFPVDCNVRDPKDRIVKVIGHSGWLLGNFMIRVEYADGNKGYWDWRQMVRANIVSFEPFSF